MRTESDKCKHFYHMKSKKVDPIEVFRQHNGILRTAEAIKLGIHPTYLYKLRDEGILESLGRGVFRLASMPDFSCPTQEVLRYYAMERFLYRLSVSLHKGSFFLKGVFKKVSI